VPIKQITDRKKEPQLPRLGKIRLGTEKTQNAPGRNTDTFRFDPTEELNGNTMETLVRLFGEKITEFRVIFPKVYQQDEQASLTWIFDANYRMFKENKAYCVGDGERARRLVPNAETGKTEWIEIACPCEFLTGKQNSLCKQQGELKVAPLALLKEGIHGYFMINTNSWNAIRGLYDTISYWHGSLKDLFWRTPFIVYKKKIRVTKDGKTFSQYIVAIKPDSEFLKIHGVGLIEDIYGIEDEVLIADDSEHVDDDDNDTDVIQGGIPGEVSKAALAGMYEASQVSPMAVGPQQLPDSKADQDSGTDGGAGTAGINDHVREPEDFPAELQDGEEPWKWLEPLPLEQVEKSEDKRQEIPNGDWVSPSGTVYKSYPSEGEKDAATTTQSDDSRLGRDSGNTGQDVQEVVAPKRRGRPRKTEGIASSGTGGWDSPAGSVCEPEAPAQPNQVVQPEKAQVQSGQERAETPAPAQEQNAAQVTPTEPNLALGGTIASRGVARNRIIRGIRTCMEILQKNGGNAYNVAEYMKSVTGLEPYWADGQDWAVVFMKSDSYTLQQLEYGVHELEKAWRVLNEIYDKQEAS
jgi:hypothetical protein